MTDFDVIVVGYGPTGKLLTRLLLDQGHTVAVVERWPATYALPRAIAYYHDARRMFHSIGMMRDIRRISRPFGHYVWQAANWDVLVDIDFSLESLSGGPEVYTFSQPDLEDMLDADIRKRSGVTFYKGYEALSVEQTADAAAVTVTRLDASKLLAPEAGPITLQARYVIGCDGANSMVRKAIGSTQKDLGFDARWLVVDVKPHDMAAHDIPDSAQWCNPEGPTTIVPCGRDKRRWEFMLRPDDIGEVFAADENVWRMLSRWIKPDEGVLVRKAIYNFRSLIADTWRDGRILLAGDAAHLMPPFMGQGMGSGLRDAWDLAWQLDLVLKGLSPETLLDAYQQERSDHVESYIRLSMEMGKVICIHDPAAAAARDAAMKAGHLPPPPIPPSLTGGVVSGTDAAVAIGAGVPLPHVMVTTSLGGIERLDDVTGRSFVVMARDGAAAVLTPAQRAALARIDASILDLGTDCHDTEGKLDRFLDGFDAVAVIARPDFHSFGIARTPQELGALVDALCRKLGLGAEPAPAPMVQP